MMALTLFSLLIGSKDQRLAKGKRAEKPNYLFYRNDTMIAFALWEESG